MSGTIRYTIVPDGLSSPIQQRGSVSARSETPDPTINATRTNASAKPRTAPSQSRPARGAAFAPGGIVSPARNEAPAFRGAAAAKANSSAGIRNSNVTPENESADPTAQ